MLDPLWEKDHDARKGFRKREEGGSVLTGTRQDGLSAPAETGEAAQAAVGSGVGDDLPHAESATSADSEAPSLLAVMQRLAADVSHLREKFDARLSYDESKEQAFDRLYADLEGARADGEFERLRPLYIDLILLFDRIEKAVETLSTESVTGKPPAELLISLRDELLEILCRRGVDLIHPSPETFEPALQRVIGTQIAVDATADNSIAAVVRRGFRHGHRLVRPEEIILRKLPRKGANSASGRPDS
jgi:molecular chaperone GrpE (heat shock protein)